MKLTLEDLPAQLERGLAGAYLVSGDEPLRVGEATDRIRARARASGFSEREVFFVERAASIWEQIEQAGQALSLFAPRRVIEVRLPTGKAGAAGGAVLERMITASGADLLLIVTGRLDRDTQKAAWVRTLQEQGVWLPVWPVEIGQLPQWLHARARIANITLSEAAAAMLAERCEGNLLAAQQEIDKLALLATPGATVGVAEVAASSADSARFDVFQLAAAVRDADCARALRILGGLQAEDAGAPLVLWALLRELHSSALATRVPMARLIARAARADRMAKGRLPQDPWDELALLAVEMCGVRTLPLSRAG